jgi:predicted NUDIX family NTP pyrophosphohydrolase
MTMRESAGLLMFRRSAGVIEVLLAHPGGPFWAQKDRGAWTIPKGGRNPGEEPIDTAIREFREETGFTPCAPFLPLGVIRQLSGKMVSAWAFEGNGDPAGLASNAVTVQWPPRSGRYITVPEIDRLQFFALDAAREAINVGQVPLLDRLAYLIDPR